MAFYGASQRAHPWLTQIATSTSINALGDANAQLLFPPPPGTRSPPSPSESQSQSQSHSYDLHRTARMVATGAALAIPVNAWYTRISLCFGGLPRAVAVALQVGLSQAVFTPVFLAGFFGVQGALEGRSWTQVRDKILTTGPRAWRDGLVLWPAVSTLNFAVVPLEYRALVGAVASLGWNSWLSYLNSRQPVQALSVASADGAVVAAGAPLVVELKASVSAAAIATTAAVAAATGAAAAVAA